MRIAVHSVMLLVLLACGVAARGAEYFVAPAGSDSNPGSKEFPFATITRAQKAAAPGDTVYIRGGTYQMQESQIAKKWRIWASVILLDKSGQEGKPIHYWAYEKETPVFDFSKVKPEGFRVDAFAVTGSWIHIRGIEVVGVQVTIKGHTQSICFHNEGSHNIYERLSMHDGQAIGIYCNRGSDNLFLNCDAYRNRDYTSEDGLGGNVDGFGCHVPKGGTGNVFRGCRAWFNSDDGFDCINSHETVTFENCWAFYNGFSPKFEQLADGNGFKAGGYSSTPEDQLPEKIPRHVARFCLAVRNKANGFYSNHHLGGSDWIHNTAFRNAANFNMLCRLADNETDVDGFGHKLRNNLSYRGGGGREIIRFNAAKCDAAGDSFTLGLHLADKDFLSLDDSQLMQPRKPNGDLPDIPFLHLAPGSQVIGKGVDAGLPLHGKAPDIGAFAK